MKKLLCLGVLASICLLTGCTKNYKTVSEYEDAMKAIRDNNQSLTIEAKQEVGTVGIYYKTLIKDNKWKTETSMNGGVSYMSGMLYDGNELLQYSQGSPYAMINPASDMLKDQDEEGMQMTMTMVNPPAALLYWNTSISGEQAVFGKKKETKNGFECRMIQYGDLEEACISDKYGIAVYRKFKDEKAGDIIYNLVKIDTSEVPDSDFQLPDGVKKMDFDTMLNEMETKLKSLDKKY